MHPYDPTVADIAGNILAGLLAADPAMPERDAIDKAIRIARGTVAALSHSPRRPTAPRVLELADITYRGVAHLPLDEAGVTRFGYSTGALAGRVVDGAIRLLIPGATAETGWNDPIYEVEFHGVGTRCTLVHNWGDVTLGKRISASGNPQPLKGLLFDDATQQLLWTCLDQYNVDGTNDPCVGSSRLEASGVTAAGLWRLADHAQKVGGYLVALPPWLQEQLGGQRFASGAPIGSGNYNAAWGAYLSAWALPDASVPPDTAGSDHFTIPTTHLITSDIDHRQPRPDDADECGWTHYGESDSGGNQPQWNPQQNGSGCTVLGELCGASFGPLTHFGAMDTISAAAWIAGPDKHGLVLIGQLARTLATHAHEYGECGRCHVWYGPPQEYGKHKLCPHGQNDVRYGPTATGPGCTTMQSSLWLYDPADIEAVLSGVKPPLCLPPVIDAADMSQIAHSGAAFPQLVSSGLCTYGGAWFEPTSRTLFLTEINAEWQGEPRPIVHAFAIAC